ncbi:MAG: hypothetical protein ABIN24_07145 [Dyadobacter sp.]
MKLRLDISRLSAKQIRTARQWVLVAIVALLSAQSFMGYLIYYSFDAPDDFNKSYAVTGKKLETIHHQTKENLLDLLDYGQKPTQKKQTTAQLAISFNLFVEKAGISIPECQYYQLDRKTLFFYNVIYFHLHSGEIPHPPQEA